MNPQFFFGEHRLLNIAKEIGPNVRELGHQWKEYTVDPFKRGDLVQGAWGTVMTGASAILEGPDYLWSGIVDQHLEAPKGIAGRMRRDTGELLGNIVGLHPIKALGDVWRLATSDWILDTGDLIGGFHTSTRSQIRKAMEPQHVLAA